MQISPRSRWTVLIYTSPSHDLEQAVRDSLQEICDGAGPPAEVQVVAQMGWQGTAQRFLLSGPTPQPLNEPIMQDMTDPKSLKSFLSWGMRAYPSDHYVVVLGGHGAGYAGALTDWERRKMMRLPDLEQALGELPRRPEMVVFNTCLMAQVEVAEQLSSVTSQLVASQSQLTGLGLPLASWLQTLPDCSQADQAGAALVASSSLVPDRAPAVAAISLNDWGSLREQLDGLAAQILEHSESRAVLVEHIRRQEHLWPRPLDRPLVDQIDLVGLCRDWQGDSRLPEGLREQAGKVAEAVVARCKPSQAGPQGLSIFAPEAPLGPASAPLGPFYQDTEWARKSSWDEALNTLVKEK